MFYLLLEYMENNEEHLALKGKVRCTLAAQSSALPQLFHSFRTHAHMIHPPSLSTEVEVPTLHFGMDMEFTVISRLFAST